MKNKFFILCLALLMVLGLVGCARNNNQATKNNTTNQVNQETPKNDTNQTEVADNGYYDGQLRDLQLRRVVAAEDAAELVVLVAAVAVTQVFATAQRNVNAVAQKAPVINAVIKIEQGAVNVAVLVDAEVEFVVNIAVCAPGVV